VAAAQPEAECIELAGSDEATLATGDPIYLSKEDSPASRRISSWWHRRTMPYRCVQIVPLIFAAFIAYYAINAAITE
jgi:hypothetical protein